MMTAVFLQSLGACFGLALCSSFGGVDAGGNDQAGGFSITEFDGLDGIDWRVVDDGVMGGQSQGKLTASGAGTMVFSGRLSLENNGGFSSFRSGEVKWDLGSEKGVHLRVKGDGRRYQVRMATDARYRGMEVSFSAEFQTRRGEWIEVRVPFTDFKGSFRGRELPEERFHPAKVRRIGLLLGDKKAGEFEIEIDFIRTYRAVSGAL